MNINKELKNFSVNTLETILPWMDIYLAYRDSLHIYKRPRFDKRIFISNYIKSKYLKTIPDDNAPNAYLFYSFLLSNFKEAYFDDNFNPFLRKEDSRAIISRFANVIANHPELNAFEKNELDIQLRLITSKNPHGVVVERRSRDRSKFSVLVKSHMINMASLPSDLIQSEIDADKDKININTEDLYVIHFDASIKPLYYKKSAGLGCVITNNRTRDRLFYASKISILKESDTLYAEGMALHFGLNIAKQLGIKNISFYGDSLGVFTKLKSGLYKNNRQELAIIFRNLNKLLNNFEITEASWVPREVNSASDIVANMALDNLKSGQTKASFKAK